MRTRGLVVYFIGACLLRGADAAAIIGVVLAARPAGAGDATGLLAACITLPHLAGPVGASSSIALGPRNSSSQPRDWSTGSHSRARSCCYQRHSAPLLSAS